MKAPESKLKAHNERFAKPSLPFSHNSVRRTKDKMMMNQFFEFGAPEEEGSQLPKSIEIDWLLSIGTTSPEW